MVEVIHHPLFGVSSTVIAYVIALILHKKWRIMHPLFIASGLLIALLAVSGIHYEAYMEGGSLIAFFLGPATIALGVPLYKNFQSIRRSFSGIIVGVTAGSMSSIVTAGAIVWVLGVPPNVLLSILTKSVTSPIAIEITAQLGGIPELGATLTVLSGLLGSMIGPEFLRLCRVRRDIPIGVAIGTSAHGIGTARLINESELQGGVSGLAMGLTGIITSLLMIPLYYLLPAWIH